MVTAKMELNRILLDCSVLSKYAKKISITNIFLSF